MPMYPLLDQIDSPAALRKLDRSALPQLARELRAFVHRVGRADRRAPVVEPRHRRAHDRAALHVRHAARPHRLGRRAPDLRAQDPDRPPRRDGPAADGGRPVGLSAPQRERVRHLRHRAFVDVDLGGARHGDRRAAQGRAAARRRGDRRRRDERRHGVRGAQQRRRGRRRPARDPQRQRDVDLGAGRRAQQLSRAAAVVAAVQHDAPRRQGDALQAAAGARSSRSAARST